jgi:SAM-dependent methyltransferase/methyltransferase-like protein
MHPVPTDQASVLELGCGDGANLIPMACDNPQGRFLGIDRAETPIQMARDMVLKLGLRNIEFQQLDLLEWSPKPGEFDYIIAHGLYTWVPPAVRESMLAACGTGLSANGLAFISYNALPGCYFRSFIGDLMKLHTRRFPDPRQKIEHMRALAGLMAKSPGETPQQLAIKKEFETLLERSGEVSFHDDLCEGNTPVYLLQFVEAAERHRLQYLSDADLHRDDSSSLLFQTGQWLEDRQYGDFQVCRRFRETILCRSGVPLDRTFRVENLKHLFLASPAEPQPEQPDGAQKFNLQKERSLTTNNVLAKQLLCLLGGQWPRAVAFSELPFSIPESQESAGVLLKLIQSDVIELRARAPQLAHVVSDHPVSSPLARAQLAEGSFTVTNQRHMSIELSDELARALVTLLDGSRNWSEVVRGLADAVQQDPEDASPPSREQLEQILAEKLSVSLNQVMRMCLLVG